MNDVVIVVMPPTTVVVQVTAPVTKTLTLGVQGPPGIQGPVGPTGPAGTSRTTKTGLIAAGGFTGSPRKAAIAFTAPYPDANYSIAISGEDSRSFTYESKSAAGFTISANANAALTGEVSWTTMTLGET